MDAAVSSFSGPAIVLHPPAHVTRQISEPSIGTEQREKTEGDAVGPGEGADPTSPSADTAPPIPPPLPDPTKKMHFLGTTSGIGSVPGDQYVMSSDQN
jgi:hypothetical protein